MIDPPLSQAIALLLLGTAISIVLIMAKMIFYGPSETKLNTKPKDLVWGDRWDDIEDY